MRLDHPTLARQAGVYHTSQARELGLARSADGRYAGSHILPAVHSVLAAPLTLRAMCFAALLYAGPHARLSGWVAATLLGWHVTPVAVEQIYVLIPHTQKTSSTSFVVISRTRIAGSMTRLGLSVATPTAILLGCALQLNYRDLTAATACALQRSEASLLQLRADLRQHPKRPGSRALTAALDELRGGAESVKELDTLREFSRLGIPEPQCQVWIFDLSGNLLCIADFYWDGIVCFYDGSTHLSKASQDGDTLKRAELAALGLQVPVITNAVLGRGRLFERRIRAAFEAAAALTHERSGPRQWVALTGEQAKLRGWC